ncbi:hypothetical protein KO317_01340 [Candidatus Micrarchaeota archaeon]|jgi:hypothetical protein|nr:hypothetical protein [Candidatus Micrarchaeota archaeon]
MVVDTSIIMTELATKFGANALNVIYAILWVIVGLLIAKIIGIALRHAFEKLGIERKIKEKRLHNALLGFTITGTIAFLFELAVFIVFLGFAAETLNVLFFTNLVLTSIEWIRMIGMAIIIIFIGMFVGELLSNKVESSKIAFSNWWSIALEVFIVYITIIMALGVFVDPSTNTRVFEGAINLLIYSFTIAIAAVFIAVGLGMGIAIGLGGQDIVKSVLKKKQTDIEKLF